MKNASEKAEAVSTTWLWIAADGSVRWGTPDKNIMKALTAAIS